MTSSISVLGVSGVCRVEKEDPTQFQPLYCVGLRLSCGVCWVSHHTRACMTLFESTVTGRIFSYAKTDKPNKPNTPNSSLIKVLNLKGFTCVGFVSGIGFSVLGSFLRGKDND